MHRIFFYKALFIGPKLEDWQLSLHKKIPFLICCMAKIYGSLSWNMTPLLWRPTRFGKVEHLAGITMTLDVNQAYNLKGEIKIYEMEESHFCLISLYLTNTHAQFLSDNQMCSGRILTTEINCNVSSTKETFKKKYENFHYNPFLPCEAGSNLFWPFSKAKSWRKYNV